MRTVLPQEGDPTFRAGGRQRDRKNAGNRLEKNPVKRADPRKHKELDHQRAEQQIVSRPSRSRVISEAEPGNPSSYQQDKNVLPFFANDPRRSGIIGNKTRYASLKTGYRFRCVQNSHTDSYDSSNYESRDQRA